MIAPYYDESSQTEGKTAVILVGTKATRAGIVLRMDMRHVLFVDVKLGIVLHQRILRAEDKLIGVELKVAEQMLAGVEDVVEVL